MQQIGQYTVVRQLDPAKPHIALAERNHTPYVLKGQLSLDSIEITALRAVQHPNIVALEDAFAAPDAYAVLEYVPGSTLSTLRAHQTFSLYVFLDLALQYCEAISTVNASGFVYNDHKPWNVMHTAGNTVKVIDFGTCLPISVKERPLATTVGYRSLQQTYSSNGLSNDVFGIGAVLYFLIEGRSPYMSDIIQCVNPREIPIRLERDQLKKGLQQKPKVKDRKLSGLVSAMLECMEEHRPTLKEVIAQLRTYLPRHRRM